MKKTIALMSMLLSLSAMAADYSCSGTEPFWDLKIEGNTVTFNEFMADETTTKEEIISRVDAQGLAPDFAFVVETKNAKATIVTGECNDGMSDNIYEKHIMYTTGNSVLYGCCNEITK
ncbi:hypothetical protein DOM21_02895 [Bacteriovorax stolpii]|uniref:COG3650 family protein n=1 Tax=Bacteriovorax stolpii TaxID=960 RepID=UPI001159B08B|nr:hypothetical protein [Bacteriovorax stolpii]QDK40417.1 hypothetical protein DOM21_02895 [Bacteriovorax stolpii]